jgi:uncharacterized membrane protein YgcG
VQCEVGYGFEGALSDSEAGRVLDFHVVPLLQRGAVAEALYHGVHLLAALIETSGDAPREELDLASEPPRRVRPEEATAPQEGDPPE